MFSRDRGFALKSKTVVSALLVGAASMLFGGLAQADGFRVTGSDVAAAQRYVTQVSRVALPAAPAPAAHRDQPLIHAGEWADYRRAFVRANGRVVDPENHGISHSESQGYGMLLAVHAQDRETFDRIWSFTRRELQIRDDNLLAWRYIPGARPAVSDHNNASDGDILVAYALLHAAALWNEPLYAHAGDQMVRDIGEKLIGWDGRRPILKPGAFGFDRIPGNRGPVVNLSYYFYAAFELFEVVQPRYPWAELARNGQALVEAARTGHRRLVPDWVSVSGGRATIAEGFDPRASYDAVRIPLYMAYARLSGFDHSAHDAAWNGRGNGVPKNRDLITDAQYGELNDPGYRMIAALSACANRNAAIPPALLRFRSTTYFASSLHLLGLVAVRKSGRCVAPSGNVLIGSATTHQPRVVAR